MDDQKQKLSIFATRTELYAATGERFEIYVQYILNLIHPNYIGTRIHGDGGIDGIILCREKQKVPIIYSIYAPEKSTNWKSKLKKIKKDLNNMNKYAEKFDDYEIRFIFNFKFNIEEAEEFVKVMNEDGRRYEHFDPDKILGIIPDNAAMQKAIGFVDGIHVNTTDLIDYNNHIFAGEVLKILNDMDHREDTLKNMDIIKNLRYSVLSYLSLEENEFNKLIKIRNFSLNSKFEKYIEHHFFYPNRNLFEITKVNSNCERAHIVTKNKLGIISYNKKEYIEKYGDDWKERGEISKFSDDKMMVIVKDLRVIYTILNNCYMEIESKGNFKLFNILRNQYHRIPNRHLKIV